MKARDIVRTQLPAFLDWILHQKNAVWFVFVFILTCVTAYVALGIIFEIVTHLPPLVNVGILLIVLGGSWRFIFDEFLYDQSNQETDKG